MTQRIKKVIEEHFKDEYVKQGLLDVVFVLEGFKEGRSGRISEEHLRDVILTAFFAQSNQPFLSTLLSVLRVPFVEALSDPDPTEAFIKKAIPAIKTILNGNTIRDYHQIARNVERDLK